MKKRCVYGPPERKLKLLETKNSKDEKDMMREKLKPKEKITRDVKRMNIAKMTKTRKGRKHPA